MSINPERRRRWLRQIIEIFRKNGATSPEKAMTPQELGLPPRFEEAMHRRLGQSGIIVESNGKYYLNEDRLEQIQEQRANAGLGGGYGGGGRTGPPALYRLVGILLFLPIGLIIAIFIFYYVLYQGGGFFPGEFLIILLIIFLLLAAVRLLFWRSRRRYWREQQL